MKRSAPTPVQTAVQTEAPCLSFSVIRTALVGLSFVVFLLIGLYFIFRTRSPQETPLASPTARAATPLRLASAPAVLPSPR